MGDSRRRLIMIALALSTLSSPPLGADESRAVRRLEALHRRMRKAAWLPQLRISFGLGTGSWTAVRDAAGNEYMSAATREDWRVNVSATWSLDRLLYHPDELRLERERFRRESHEETP